MSVKQFVNNSVPDSEVVDLKSLQPQQVAMIDQAIARVGEYGEVHLVIEKGSLRFIVVQHSYDARRWTGNPVCIE
jgi:hypothetical protein